MPTKLKILILFTLAVAALCFYGCTTPNPNYNPSQPPSPTNPPFSVDPRINDYSNRVAQIAQAAAPANPYAGVTDLAIKWGFGLAFGISAIVAGIKNKQAGTATNALGVIADGVVKAGAGPAVLDHASTTDHFATVANAINASTGANQTSTGLPKTS